MPCLTRITFWAVLLTLLPMLTGCIKLKQAVTVMPDGSGKIELTFALSDVLIEQAKADKGDAFAEVRPAVMADKCAGIAAFTEPVIESADGFTSLRYTAYFKDINRVRIEGLGEGKPATYRYKRDGESATLTMMHGTTLGMISDYTPIPQDERDEARKAMAGMYFSEQFTLPGPIDAITGIQTQANTAKLDLTLDNIVEGTGPIDKLKDKNKLTFNIPKITTDQATVDAFKKEFATALTEWETEQAESK